jgi:hypothetical protein
LAPYQVQQSRAVGNEGGHSVDIFAIVNDDLAPSRVGFADEALVEGMMLMDCLVFVVVEQHHAGRLERAATTSRFPAFSGTPT